MKPIDYPTINDIKNCTDTVVNLLLDYFNILYKSIPNKIPYYFMVKL